MLPALDDSSSLSGPPSARPTVVVCETKPYWTPELQRQFVGECILVRGCRKWSELTARSDPSARVVDVVDLEDRPAELLTGLARGRRTWRMPPLIVIASPRWKGLENVLREAGVQAFFPDLPTGPELARCCRRWLDLASGTEHFGPADAPLHVK